MGSILPSGPLSVGGIRFVLQNICSFVAIFHKCMFFYRVGNIFKQRLRPSINNLLTIFSLSLSPSLSQSTLVLNFCATKCVFKRLKRGLNTVCNLVILHKNYFRKLKREVCTVNNYKTAIYHVCGKTSQYTWYSLVRSRKDSKST